MKTFKLLFIVLIVGFGSSGCGVINKVRLMNANNDLEPVWMEGRDIATPNADYVYAKPYIFASIDGVHNLKLLIDTGSSISMLFDTEKVKGLQLPKGYELEVGGYGGHQNTAAYQTQVSQLKIDALTFNNVHFGYIPLTKTKFFLRPDQAGFDGVIGNDILRGLVWHFDRDSMHVSIHKTLPSALHEKAITWTDFDTFFGKISFPVKITFNDHTLERDIILDTGSRYHMSINDGYFDDDKAFPTPYFESAGYSLSGMALHHKANVPAVEINELKITNILTNIIQEDEDDFWTLGSALLSQYEIIVDYPARKLGFVTRKGQTFKNQYNLLGLELRKLQNGNFVAVYISPDLPASDLGFQIGDEVTQINNTPASSISVDSWLEMVSVEGEFELCVLGAQQCKAVTSTLLDGFPL